MELKLQIDEGIFPSNLFSITPKKNKEGGRVGIRPNRKFEQKLANYLIIFERSAL